MKIELHIKQSRFGFSVSYKDKKIWRTFALDMPFDVAYSYAEKLIKDNPERYFKTICDCKTPIIDFMR